MVSLSVLFCTLSTLSQNRPCSFSQTEIVILDLQFECYIRIMHPQLRCSTILFRHNKDFHCFQDEAHDLWLCSLWHVRVKNLSYGGSYPFNCWRVLDPSKVCLVGHHSGLNPARWDPSIESVERRLLIPDKELLLPLVTSTFVHNGHFEVGNLIYVLVYHRPMFLA